MPAPIIVDPRVSVPPTAMTVAAVRSSGPGGQNVNKVSSKIELRVDLSAILGLEDDARARLLTLAANRLDAEGLLFVTSQRTRDREKNLADAMEKVAKLIQKALVRPVPRKKTKPSRAMVRRRLEEKRLTGEKKQARARIAGE